MLRLSNSFMTRSCAIAVVTALIGWEGLTVDASGSVPSDTMSASPSSEAGYESAFRFREITIPAGTRVPITLETTVASDSSRVEDQVRARTRSAVRMNGYTVIPAGSTLIGTVSDARRPGKVKGRGRVAFRFHSLTIAGDETYRVSTGSIARVAPATKKKDAAKIAIPAAGGAIIGAIAGGKKGAAIGGTVGGGAGTGVVLATRGPEVRVLRGSQLSVTLRQPLTVRVPV